MTFTVYWARVVKANPQLADDGYMRISVTQFQRALERAYANGRTDEINKQKAEEPLNSLKSILGM